MKLAHLRAAEEIVELDPADGGVGLEVRELVSQQKSRHDRLFSPSTHARDDETAEQQEQHMEETANEETREGAGFYVVH